MPVLGFNAKKESWPEETTVFPKPLGCMEELQNSSAHEEVQSVSGDNDWRPEENSNTDNVKYRSGNGDLSFCCLGASNWLFLLSVQMLCVCVCVCVCVCLIDTFTVTEGGVAALCCLVQKRPQPAVSGWAGRLHQVQESRILHATPSKRYRHSVFCMRFYILSCMLISKVWILLS